MIQGVITTSACLRYMVTEKSLYYVTLYRHYKNGVLLVSGGLLDQPNKYTEAMDLIEAYGGINPRS